MRARAVILVALCAVWLGGSPVLAGTLKVTVTDQKNTPLEDAVVIAMPVSVKPKSQRPPAPQAPQIIDQINKQFVPFVKVIQTNTSVVFPNKDNIRHHVYSFSPAKKFELPLYAGVPANPVVFDKPGIVVLGCNIHDWMLAYVQVTDSPYHGVTAKEGSVVLESLDAGAYEIRGWHPGLINPEGAAAKRIRLDTAQPATVTLQLAVKPITRGRRAPRPGGGGYR
jgi:hypothetical protein